MQHLGGLESTQEVRVALDYASSNYYASFVLSKLPRASYLDERTLTYEPIVKYLFTIFRMLLEPCQRESRSILCKFPFRNQFGSYVIVFVDTFYHKTGGKSFHWRKRLVFSRTAAQTSPCFDLSYKLFQKRMS